MDVVDSGNYAALPANPRPLLQHQDSYEIPRSHGGSYADYDVPRQHPGHLITRISSVDDSRSLIIFTFTSIHLNLMLLSNRQLISIKLSAGFESFQISINS